jgi:hypothetical protein
MRERDDDGDIPLDDIPALLQGFDQLYPLLRCLASSQDMASFYERIQILMLLARWTGEPLTLREMHRVLPFPIERLSHHLSRLRASEWLTSEDRTYTLTMRGRLLIFVLRLIAQPWQERDSVAVITQLYAAASSEELGLGSERLFEEVVAAIEASLRRLRRAVSAERTSLVSQYHEESLRNARMADMALELRQQGVAADDFDHVARMHHAISALSVLSGQLEQQHLTLLERDLLTSGQVTLGDVQTWAAQADDAACAAMIAPHLEGTIPQPWYLHEGALIAAEAEVSRRAGTRAYREAPLPQHFRPLDKHVVMDTRQQHLSTLQGHLRQRVLFNAEDLPLAEWVQQDEWRDALAHLIAALDPLLRIGKEPIYLHLHHQGQLVTLEEGAAQQVSDGILSRKESSYVS